METVKVYGLYNRMTLGKLPLKTTRSWAAVLSKYRILDYCASTDLKVMKIRTF